VDKVVGVEHEITAVWPEMDTYHLGDAKASVWPELEEKGRKLCEMYTTVQKTLSSRTIATISAIHPVERRNTHGWKHLMT
jgi:hypothetical protein